MPNPTGNTTSSGDKDTVLSAPLPDQFHGETNWMVYQARIEQFFVAYNITKMERMRAIMLTSLSTDVYEELLKLCFPDLPESKTLKELYGIMKLRYSPYICVLDERVKFYKAEQNKCEPIVAFAARLKGLARYCKFDAYLQDVLRDKFISGLTKGPVASKVLELEHTATFEDCIQVALKKELTAASDKSAEVFKIVSSTSKRCSVCGKANHESQQCKYKAYECKNCKKKGHLARMCKQKVDSENHFMCSGSDSDESLNCFGLY